MTWERVKVGLISNQVRGVAYEKADLAPNASDLHHPVLRANNIQNGETVLDDLVYVSTKKLSRQQYLREGDVLIAASSGSLSAVGKAARVREDMRAAFGAFCKVIRPDVSKVDSGYFGHYFQSEEYRRIISSLAQGANINNIRNEHINNLEIPLPPLPVQQQIAAVLDEVDALRQKRERNIKNLEIYKALFIEEFTGRFRDNMGKLGDLITVGPTNGLYRPASDYGSGTPIIRIDAFYDGVVTDISTLKRVNIPEEIRRKFNAKPKSIVINRVNSREYLGKSAIIPPHEGDLVFESNMMRFEVDELQILPEYLIECMQLPEFKRQVMQRCKDAVNQSSINQQDVKSFCVPVGPIQEQRRLIAAVQEFNQLLILSRRQLSQTSNLLSSLQVRAFSGALELRDLEALL